MALAGYLSACKRTLNVPYRIVCVQLLNLQTEEGPSPAAPEHIQDLPTVSIQQETVGECAVMTSIE